MKIVINFTEGEYAATTSLIEESVRTFGADPAQVMQGYTDDIRLESEFYNQKSDGKGNFEFCVNEKVTLLIIRKFRPMVAMTKVIVDMLKSMIVDLKELIENDEPKIYVNGELLRKEDEAVE